MRHNPVEDLSLLHCDLVMSLGMVNTVIEAAMSGECSTADIGNSLAILKEYLDKRLDLLEDENRKLRGLSILYEDTISDRTIMGIYEEYIGGLVEGGRIKSVESYYDRASRILDLLPEEQQESSWRSIREAGAPLGNRASWRDSGKRVRYSRIWIWRWGRMERPFLTPEDVAEDTGLSLEEAVELVKYMAKQLRAAGYLVVTDRVQRSYYEKQKAAGFLISVKKEKEYVPLCDKRLLSVGEFCSYASIGKDRGMELAEAAGAVFRTGRRVMIDRGKFDRWCDENSCISEEG